MKIGNINIQNSTVTIAEKISNSSNKSSLGLDENELLKLVAILKEKEVDVLSFVTQNFSKEDLTNLTNDKKNNFIAGFKKFGFDFATKLTSSGIVELLKYFIVT